MDFSTPERSLRSILRRTPPLPDDVLTASRSLLPHFAIGEGGEGGVDVAGDEKVMGAEGGAMAGVLSLLDCSRKINGDDGDGDDEKREGGGGKRERVRWEPLAVGTYLAMEMLDDLARGLNPPTAPATRRSPSSPPPTEAAGRATHYVDGPRLPDLVTVTVTTTEASPPTGGDAVATRTSTSTWQPAAADSPSPTSSSSSADVIAPTSTSTSTPPGPGGSSSTAAPPLALAEFCRRVLESALDNMEHDEPRVRTLVARTLGAHARLTAAAAAAAVIPASAPTSASGTDAASATANAAEEETRGAGAERLAVELERQRGDAGDRVVGCLVGQWRYKRGAGGGEAPPPPLKSDPNELGGMDMSPTTPAPDNGGGVASTPPPSMPAPAAASSPVDSGDGGDEGMMLEHGGGVGDSPSQNPRHVHPLDDTSGWRALETSLHAYASWIDGCGASYWLQGGGEGDGGGSEGAGGDGGGGGGGGYGESLTGRTLAELAPLRGGEEDEEDDGGAEKTLLDVLELCCTVHVNRHVRAAGLQALEQLVKSASAASAARLVANGDGNPGGAEACPPQLGDGSPLRSTVARVLKITLADNWSQVRMAASVLCRTLFLAIKDDPSKADLYSTLLPRMCLNRFYLAQGVKLYSQDTWRLVLNEDGPIEVARHAAQVSRYYAKMCDADNHVVREAGCQAIAELAQKLGTSEEYSPYLAPYVPVLLQALLVCFFDESWPVRDEACLACGTFAKAYPDECRPELPVLFERWCEQLTDQIWSVREDAAVALGDAMAAYGDEILDKLLPKIEAMLPGARNQPPMTREELLATHNDAERHTDSQLYSCGSLAPKLGRGSSKARSVGGCSDCKLTRPPAPWEATDGCVYMIRELCRASSATTTNVELGDDRLLPLMRELADVCRVKHFPQADDLRTTLWKQLPEMARALGKQRFKRHYLDLFLDLLASNVEDRSASQLSVCAAEHCCVELAGIVGRGIFLGRAEDYHRAALERCLVGAREKAGGPGNMPFGGGMPPLQAGALFPPQPVPGRMPF